MRSGTGLSVIAGDLPDFTTVVAVDDSHERELKVTWPTWACLRPEILQQPLLLICDGSRPAEEWEFRLSFVQHPARRIVLWDMPDVDQREKMLTGLTVLPPREITTAWYLKLDTDAVAVRGGAWFQREWFQPDIEGQLPVFVGCSWGYTKPPDAIKHLDEWANPLPAFRETRPLNLQPEPGSELIRHPRITSWCFFARTTWVGEMAALCPNRLPIPSHDTFLWYCAERRGEPYRRVSMGRYGWVHTPSQRKLEQLARQAVATRTTTRTSTSSSSVSSQGRPQDSFSRAVNRARPCRTLQAGCGVAYLLTGTSHAVRLVTSLASLREHFTGPVTLFTTEPGSHELGTRIATDPRLGIQHRRFRRRFRRRNASYLSKVQLLESMPYAQTVYLDADTLVVGDISELFEFSATCQLVATQFSDWTSDRRPVRKRIESWRGLPEERFLGVNWKTLLDSAIQSHPAINSGVFAVRRGAEISTHWLDLTVIGRRKFICDEIALQILLHHFPHRVLDCRWNCSPIYGTQREDARIWHFHGAKHLHPAAFPVWWPQYQHVVKNNFAGVQDWTPGDDPRLAAFLRQEPAACPPITFP